MGIQQQHSILQQHSMAEHDAVCAWGVCAELVLLLLGVCDVWPCIVSVEIMWGSSNTMSCGFLVICTDDSVAPSQLARLRA